MTFSVSTRLTQVVDASLRMMFVVLVFYVHLLALNLIPPVGDMVLNHKYHVG